MSDSITPYERACGFWDWLEDRCDIQAPIGTRSAVRSQLQMMIEDVIKAERDSKKGQAEAEVIAAADAFYDLAHATLPELRMVDQWKEVTKRMDKTVQTLRKIRAEEQEERRIGSAGAKP